MKNILGSILLAILATIGLFCGGCTFMFSRNSQRVTVKTTTPGATIYYNNDSIGQGSASIKLDKKRVYQGVTVAKEGFKTMHYGFQLSKLSPAAWFGILDLGIPIAFAGAMSIDQNASAGDILFPFFTLGGSLLFATELSMPRTHRYYKVQLIPELVPMEKRETDEKYLLANSVRFDVEKGRVLLRGFRNISDEVSYKAWNRGLMLIDKSLKIDNTIFTKNLNYALFKMNFVDTTGNIFPSVSNALYLDARITGMAINLVGGKFKRFSTLPNCLVSVDLEIEWDLLDFYRQKIFTTKTNVRSDLFLLLYSEEEGAAWPVINKAISDNLEYALISIRKEFKENGFLEKSAEKQGPLFAGKDIIILKKPVYDANKKFNDYHQSSVSIKADENLSSGVIISDDGYIVASLAGIASAQKVDVYFSDSMSFPANIVRKDVESGLVLLRVARTGLAPFLISQEPEPEIGVDVWAIGTIGKVTS